MPIWHWGIESNKMTNQNYILSKVFIHRIIPGGFINRLTAKILFFWKICVFPWKFKNGRHRKMTKCDRKLVLYRLNHRYFSFQWATCHNNDRHLRSDPFLWSTIYINHKKITFSYTICITYDVDGWIPYVKHVINSTFPFWMKRV